VILTDDDQFSVVSKDNYSSKNTGIGLRENDGMEEASDVDSEGIDPFHESAQRREINSETLQQAHLSLGSNEGGLSSQIKSKYVFFFEQEHSLEMNYSERLQDLPEDLREAVDQETLHLRKNLNRILSLKGLALLEPAID